MNKLHRKLEYALIALKHMSLKEANGGLTTAKEVSDTYHAPFEPVARSLQMMAQRGLLKSAQGVQGGYLIQKSLEQISLLELIEIMEGPTQIAKCLGADGPACEIHGSCNIITPVQTLNKRLTDFYQSLSVREILADSNPKIQKVPTMKALA